MSGFLQDVLPICSGIIAATGFVTNLLSLTYFTRKPKRTMTTRIFLFLNTFDIFVCLVGTVLVISTSCEGQNSLCDFQNPVFIRLLSVMNICVETTAFATCLLSVTRTISLCFPFYPINRNMCGTSVAVFLIQEFVRFILFHLNKSRYDFFHVLNKYLIMSVITSAIICSFISSSLSVWKLLSNKKKNRVPSIHADVRANTSDKNQKATITILIVSILFCLMNSIYCVNIHIRLAQPAEARTTSTVLVLLHEFSIWLAIPLNSALNPAIYFTRKMEMRVFIKRIFCLRQF